MAERYTRLFTLAQDLYVPGAPLVIAAGALLKDTQTGQVLAQLKLRSISDPVITAVNLQVIGYDMSKTEICREEHQYLDLRASRDDMFGSKEAIPMSRHSVRSFAVQVLAVFFEDGSSYSGPDARWTSLPEQEALNVRLFDTELIRQYRLETSEHSQYVPLEYKDLWLCSCAEINHPGEPCYRCGRCLDDVKRLLNVELLRERKTERLREEASRAAREEEKRKSLGYRLRRLALIVVPLLLIAALACGVLLFNSARARSYDEAMALFESGDYAGAAEAFDRIPRYRDAAAQAARAREADAIHTSYIRAGKLMENGRFGDAQDIYLSLGDYLDSARLATEAEYREGLELIETGEYEKARDLFSKLGDYKDSAEISAHFFDRLITEEVSFEESVDGPLATVYTYDSQGRIATMTERYSVYPDREDKVYLYSWNDDGSYDVREGQVVLHYDEHGSYLGQGEQTAYTYDYAFFDNGVMHYRETYDAVTGDYLGGFVNDEHGNKLQVTDKGGDTQKVKSEYNGDLLVKQESFASDGTLLDRTTYEYDGQGRVRRTSYLTPGASAAVARSYTYGLVFVPEAES